MHCTVMHRHSRIIPVPGTRVDMTCIRFDTIPLRGRHATSHGQLNLSSCNSSNLMVRCDQDLRQQRPHARSRTYQRRGKEKNKKTMTRETQSWLDYNKSLQHPFQDQPSSICHCHYCATDATPVSPRLSIGRFN